MNEGEIVNGIIEQAKTQHAATLENMAKLVHATWRDGMLRQGRPVDPQRLDWDTLEEEDRELDRMIARGIWERLEEKAAQFNFGYDLGLRDAVSTVEQYRFDLLSGLQTAVCDELVKRIDRLSQ